MLELEKRRKNPRKRTSQEDIVRGLFKTLNDGRTHNADEIAKLCKLSWGSVINWMNLIVMIQSGPQVGRERVGRTNLYHIPFEQVRRFK